MNTNVDALKALYVALGGMIDDVEDFTLSVEVLNAIAALFDGESDAQLNSDAIENLAEVAGDLIKPSGTKTITENGTHDVTEFETAEVNVAGLVPTGTKSITENGTYDVTEFASADVDVSGGEPVFAKLTIVNNSEASVTIGQSLSYDEQTGKICPLAVDNVLAAGETKVFDAMFNPALAGPMGVFTVSASSTYSFNYSASVGTVEEIHQTTSVGKTFHYILLGGQTNSSKTITITNSTAE